MKGQYEIPAVYWPASEVAQWGSHEDEQIRHALQLLEQVKALAVVPVSQFQVAAIAFDALGNAYAGMNQEFAGVAMAQTVHAEQSAIAHAWIRGANLIRHIVVNYPPCGHCRQFMNELRESHALHIHLPQRQHLSLHSFLPEDFGPADLAVATRLLDVQCHLLSTSSATDDSLADAALTAAKMSYAPYSHAYAGVALRLYNGEVITGAYAENAAYNPSLPPLQVALNMLHLRGLTVAAVVDAVFARVPRHGQYAHAQLLWQSISKIRLRAIALTAI